MSQGRELDEDTFGGLADNTLQEMLSAFEVGILECLCFIFLSCADEVKSWHYHQVSLLWQKNTCQNEREGGLRPNFMHVGCLKSAFLVAQDYLEEIDLDDGDIDFGVCMVYVEYYSCLIVLSDYHNYVLISTVHI